MGSCHESTNATKLLAWMVTAGLSFVAYVPSSRHVVLCYLISNWRPVLEVSHHPLSRPILFYFLYIYIFIYYKYIHKYIYIYKYMKKTRKIIIIKKFILKFFHWVLREKSFKQLLVTHPVVITKEGANWS